jgi:hypothetical protein
MKTLDFIGLNEKKVQTVVDNLNILLADLQVFYTNMRGYHWNVKGPGFFQLHEKYEYVYNDLAAKIDEVAERIIQLGAVAENRFSEYLKIAEVKETAEVKPGSESFLFILDTYKTIIARERKIVELASEAGDDTTVAIMDDFLKGQEKAVWMFVAVSAK